MKTQAFIRTLENVAERAKARHLGDFDRDPAYALQWSRETFEQIAMGKVAKEIRERIERTQPEPEALQRWVTMMALQVAHNANGSSSSQVANVFERDTVRAWAYFARWLAED